MKSKWLMIVVGVLVLVLVGLIVKSKFFNKQGPGALQITTSPRATVFVDGNQVGVSPFFNDNIQSGEHTIKIVPESTVDGLSDWETKVDLLPGILTVINRDFGSTEALSSGEILSLEKTGRKDMSSIAVVSIPDRAVVKLEGEPKGFAPLTIDDLVPGDYQIVISASGYEERTISANTIGGYKLIINVQLAQQIEGIEEATDSAEVDEEEETAVEENEDAEPTATPTPKAKVTPPATPYVEIKDTPTGFLRVREDSSTDSEELIKVDPGDFFPYIEEENGWYKIEYEDGEEGWISGVYADLVE